MGIMGNKEIKLQLIKEGDFLGTKCDFYKDEDNNIYMTREQIGKALQYANPRDGIFRIHERNKDRLDRFSIQTKIKQDEGGRTVCRDMYVYTKEGIIEIVKISTQPIKYKKPILKMLGLSNSEIQLILGNNINKKYKQHQLHKILSTVYPHLRLDTEVKIDDFRVDFILEDFIVIECDEFGHADRDFEYEEHREWYLSEWLGYNIVRYNPDSDDNLEVFRVLQEINSILSTNNLRRCV